MPLSAYLYEKIENNTIMSFNIEKILGKEANYLLDHKCKTVKKEHLHLPGPDFVLRQKSCRTTQYANSL